MKINSIIDKTWLKVLEKEFKKPYFENIEQTITSDINNGEVIYPPINLIFNAFNSTPFDELKVVILGQDPYHGTRQAHGLCFSVQDGINPPPSLKNIYKEIESDIGIKKDFTNGNLTSWAKEGVMLLNAFLTVKAGKPASHSKIGWETFTDTVIKTISDKKTGVIFLLWGNFAKSKKSLINTKKHYILEAPHPSPFSTHKGFFGCKHFSKTNEILKELGKNEIDWSV